MKKNRNVATAIEMANLVGNQTLTPYNVGSDWTSYQGAPFNCHIRWNSQGFGFILGTEDEAGFIEGWVKRNQSALPKYINILLEGNAYTKSQKGLPNRYVGVVKDSRTNEVYAVFGEPKSNNAGMSLGQLKKYIKFVIDKDQYVRAGMTNTEEFYEWIGTEQKDGSDDRGGTGFAAKIPNGSEAFLMLEIYEFKHPEEFEKAKAKYRELVANSDQHVRAEFTMYGNKIKGIGARAPIKFETGSFRNFRVEA
jgi:hypothetical protein